MPGMGLEGKHSQGCAELSRVLSSLGDNAKMTAMQAVEIAQRDHRATRVRGNPVVMSKDAHERAFTAIGGVLPSVIQNDRARDRCQVLRGGSRTSASPSMTTVLPTVQMVWSLTRRRSRLISVMVARTRTVSPARTGALNRTFWLI